jgi:glutamine transport system substrate-binding protein
MKRRTLLASLLAGVVAASFASAAMAKELIVGTDTSFMPFEFKQGNAYVGFDIDLWKAIAKDQNLQFRLQPMDFAGLIPALQTNNIDVTISGMSIKPARQQVIDFSDPYYISGIAAVVANNSTAKSPLDLNGKVVAAKTGTTSIDYVKSHLKVKELREFPNIDQAYMALQAGRVDAVIHDTPNVQYFANTVGKGKVKVLPPALSGDEYGIGFPKGSPLVAQVNAGLKHIRANGEYARIYKKWFGVELK